MNQIIQKIFDDSLSMRDQIFQMVLAVSVVGLVPAIGYTIYAGHYRALVALLISLAVFALSAILTFRLKMFEFCQTFIYLMVCLIILPMIFWSFGGAESLTVMWVILLYFYLFHMFSGKKLAFLFLMTVLVDGLLFYGSYRFPQYNASELNRMGQYVLMYLSVLMIGVFIGGILWLQVRLFDKERRRYEEQARGLEASRDLKSELYANLSHEIRTPINSIIGAGEVMMRDTGWTESQMESLNIVSSAAAMLHSMVNDILDISLLENHRLELDCHDYDTRTFFRDIASIAKHRCEEKGLKLYLKMNIEMPSMIHGDERRVRQILLNILNNSVKFTDQGSVTMDVQGIPINDRQMELKVTIADTGIGIRKEEIDSVFEAFRRSKDANEGNMGGAGLGLSISKQLAVLMGGDITIDSIYKRGTIFTITLRQEIVDGAPVGEIELAEENRIRERYHASFEAPRARILVVDDNEINGIITKSLLEPTKAQVDVVRSGAECLILTRERYYDVILMDFLMPKMNGVETFKEIRKQENGLCHDSSVMILTANAQSSAKVICQENGFDGYLEKPLYGATLEREVVKFLPKEIVEYRNMEYDNSGNSMLEIVGKKRKKIYITADCTCDLSEEILERFDIKVMYMRIKTPGGCFIDTKEIDSTALPLYLEHEKDAPIRPSAPSVRAFEEFFAEALAQAEEVIHISMASYAGETYGNAVEAAKGFAHVHVIDSGQISCGEGILVQHAARMALEGYSSEGIIRNIEQEKSKVRCFVFTPSVEAFMTRHYIGKFWGSILYGLHLCPTIEVTNSKPRVGEITIGMPQVAQRRFLHKHLRHNRRINDDMLMISYVNKSARELEAIHEEVNRCMTFRRFMVQRACFSTGCSAGNGAVCIAYLEK